MQVMTSDIHHQNSLYRSYEPDQNVLLDRTTYSFANSVDRSIEINFVDNLAMIIRSINDHRNSIRAQLEFVNSENIIDLGSINALIDKIKEKYEVKIDNLPVEETSEANTELFSGEKEGAEGFGRLTLESILGDDSNQENIEFYKRFI